MNQKCITRLKAQTMHFMLHNTDWLYSSISTDDCRGFWNSCTLYLPVQHTGTYANIHPICSPFLRFRQLYKSSLDLDSAIYSVVCGRAHSGKEAAERDGGGESKKNVFRIWSKLKNIIEIMKEFDLLFFCGMSTICVLNIKLIFRVTANKKIWFINFLQEAW